MKRSSVFYASVLLWSFGCAGPSTLTGDVAAARGGCETARRYTEEDMAVIEHMRDDGAGRKEVAARVGGTRWDVKCVELAARARRQAIATGELMVNERTAAGSRARVATTSDHIAIERVR